MIKKENDTYYETGFGELDACLKLQKNKGILVTIGARPYVGKGAFMLSIVKNLLEKNEKILYFSLETSKKQLFKRYPSLKTNLYVDDTIEITPECIEEKIKDIKPSIVFIDCLQAITGRQNQDRCILISELMKKLKQITIENNVPIFIGSPLSREIENRQNKRPRLSDFRGSGAIQDLSDIIMFIYCAECDEESISSKTKIELEIIIAKNESNIKENVLKITLER